MIAEKHVLTLSVMLSCLLKANNKNRYQATSAVKIGVQHHMLHAAEKLVIKTNYQYLRAYRYLLCLPYVRPLGFQGK